MQADILWDNIQYLSEPDGESSETNDEGPQVFLLSGYGQPGSAINEQGDTGESSEGSSVARSMG